MSLVFFAGSMCCRKSIATPRINNPGCSLPAKADSWLLRGPQRSPSLQPGMLHARTVLNEEGSFASEVAAFHDEGPSFWAVLG